ncbi:MAG: family 78 glycoside hydrolase catalytic domain [Cytophagales bacterium]|nr:family 78 glycoside hydrolase catalytic domain [Cytophagales bacterium]
MKICKVLLLFFLSTGSFAQLSPPEDLRTEYLKGVPLIDLEKPRLGWINTAIDHERAQTQTAYQVQVSSIDENWSSPLTWDSKKINSSANQRIVYQGKHLLPGQKYRWRVRVWDKDDKVSEWSKPAQWQMGLNQSDWKAEWIGAPWQGEEAIPKPPGGPNQRTEILPPPAPYLRKTFELNKKVKRAVVFTTGLGYFEFYANGKKVSDDVLVPNQTNYGKRPDLTKAYIAVPDEFAKYKVMYLAYDITDFLQNGNNAIGAILGNGFYNDPKFWTASYGSPRFIAQVQIHYEDGSKEIIKTDKSWKSAKSGILVDLVYDGEIYDARKEIVGWCNPEYDASQWQNAALRKAPYGDLVAHTAETDKVTKQYRPSKITKLGEGRFKVDFPEEISGWVRLKNVQGPAGQKVHITFNGNLYSGENTYYFKGEGLENYAPRFNWFVFSGVEISGWPGELSSDQISAEAVNTDIKENAVFETSNELFNQINQIWKRSQLDNSHGGIASDCPHRERSGYTGDAQVACPTVMHNFDARAFYQKWVADMREAQIPSTGYVPNGAPWQPGCGGGVAWGAAINIIPWEYYLQYGAKDMLADNYDAMKGYIKYMKTWETETGTMHSQRNGNDGKPLKWWNLGDWAGVCSECLPDDALVHTFYYWYCADITAKTAKILGFEKDAEAYAELAARIKKAFHQVFYNNQKKSYEDYGSNVFALKMGVPSEFYNEVKSTLMKEVERNKGHLNTGIFGTRFFFEVLADNGMNALAYDAMNKTTEPSFGRWLELGSTTSREHWGEEGSYNHPMFGGGLVWFYRHLAGFNFDESAPGYEHIIIKPSYSLETDFIKYETNTSFGKAKIELSKKVDSNSSTNYNAKSKKTTQGQKVIIKYEIEVPVGSYATIYSPMAQPTLIKENGVYASENRDLEYVGNENGPVYQVKSGKYSFEYTYFITNAEQTKP